VAAQLEDCQKGLSSIELVSNSTFRTGARGSVEVDALCYKLEVSGSRPDEVNEFIFLNLPNPSGLTRPWGSLSL
jgi:hypothetical protein